MYVCMLRDRPAVYILKPRYNKTYSQKERRTLLYQKLEAAYTLKLRLQDSYKSDCKPPEDPSPQTDKQ